MADLYYLPRPIMTQQGSSEYYLLNIRWNINENTFSK